MAEDKKAFLQGKMNKDIDARLLPNGEYRTAQNIQISTSEAQDVGTIQNIKGNSLVPLRLLDGFNNLETIGSYFDEPNDRTFYFITNYICPNSTEGGLIGASDGPKTAKQQETEGFTELNPGQLFCAILMYKQDGSISVLSQGLFLNFSTTHEITGVNILNNLLFFTDNFNQPRRINISTALNNSGFYDSEKKISVAKFAPFYPLRLLDSSNESSATTDTDIESDFLENQFVRFSYRFRYEDGEYSTIAPFTQAVFLPEIYKGVSTGLSLDQIKKMAQNNELDSMINCINKIIFQLKMPENSSNVFNTYQIKEVQILCAIDGDLPIRVVDVLPNSTTVSDAGIIDYTYESSEPFKTLPRSQGTRVFDNVPLKAKSQEIIGNRVVYGNYIEKRNLSKTRLNFEVNTSLKNAGDSSESDYLYKEYKYHSIKQRREYQVGVVLSDIFGRQSPVILPIELNGKTSLKRSSAYVPAKSKDLFDSSVWNDYSVNSTNTENWGDVLRIRFEDIIGDAYDSDTNPYGWYSYRIVVKQQQQEYYNVYGDGIARNTSSPTALINLSGDNVNKVPRDVTDTDRETGLAGSKIRLYPKVVNYNVRSIVANNDPDPDYASYEAPYVPNVGGLLSSDGLLNVIEIGTLKEHGINPDLLHNQAYFDSTLLRITGIRKGLLLAKIALPDNTTNLPAAANQGAISVFETEPFNSKIDIFYETSSAGLVSDINTSVAASFTGLNKINIQKFNGGIQESDPIGSKVGIVTASNDQGQQDATISLLGVQQINRNTNVSTQANGKFEIIEDPLQNKYYIKTKEEFFYGTHGYFYTFNIQAVFGGETITKTIENYTISSGGQFEERIKLENALPVLTLTNDNEGFSYATGSDQININEDDSSTNEDVLIGRMRATNGSADTNNQEFGLLFEDVNNPVTDPTSAFPFIVNEASGEIFIRQGASLEQGNVSMTITVFEDEIENIVDSSGNKPFQNKQITIVIAPGQVSSNKSAYITQNLPPSPWAGIGEFQSASNAERTTLTFILFNGSGDIPEVNDLVQVKDETAPGGWSPFNGQNKWWGANKDFQEISSQAVQINENGIVIAEGGL